MASSDEGGERGVKMNMGLMAPKPIPNNPIVQ